MNKKLVAVAVAGMLAAPLAAQAQTANVTLYGRLNLDAEVINVKQDVVGGGGKQNVFRVMSNSSRLGVRGSEALGGGLSAVFQIESAVGATAGGGLGSTLGTRETFVGLQGGWGTVKMGYFLTPYDDIHPIFGNVPTLATSMLGTPGALVEHRLVRQLPVRRRVRRPCGQFDPLRLAEHRAASRAACRSAQVWPVAIRPTDRRKPPRASSPMACRTARRWRRNAVTLTCCR